MRYGKCPFCGHEVEMVRGITGLIMFVCLNDGNCGARISFGNKEILKGKTTEIQCFKRRKGIN